MPLVVIGDEGTKCHHPLYNCIIHPSFNVDYNSLPCSTTEMIEGHYYKNSFLNM